MGLKQRIKYSGIFGLYERVFRPAVRAAHLKEVRLYREILGKRVGLIFDIGAYDGHKTAAFLELGARVVACEPDAYNFQLLTVRFRGRRRVTLLKTALGEKEGTAELLVHHPGSAFNTLNVKWKKMLEEDGQARWKEEIRFADEEKVRVTTLDELIRVHGVPDFIKIDVEGYEKFVLDGLHQRVSCISFECQLPEFKDDLLAILRRLEDGSMYNVVYAEELVLPEWVGYEEILKWVQETKLFSFDMVIKKRPSLP